MCTAFAFCLFTMWVGYALVVLTFSTVRTLGNHLNSESYDAFIGSSAAGQKI
jgi:hypothetical protein